jgi:hypothetical protein
MPRECPGCGAAATREARFCRRCGVPFRVGGGHDTDSPISPKAQTVPLADDGRTTDGLLTEESQQLASGTSRIRRAEMEDMLRRVSREHDVDGHASHRQADGDGESPPAVPATSTLQTPSANATSLNASSIATTIPKASAPRRPYLWRLCVITLLSLTIITGLLAFIFYRRSSVAKAGDTSAAPVGEEKQQDASAGTMPSPGQDVSTETTAPPTTSKSRPEPSRAPNGTEAATTRPASQTPDASTTTTSVPSPQPRQTTTTPPSLSAADHYRRGVQLWEGDRRAALEEFRAAASGGYADAYYYLGSEYYPEGRDPKTLSEGELRAALNYFLRAGGGPHSAQAARAAQALGKEYERRKKHSRP